MGQCQLVEAGLSTDHSVPIEHRLHADAVVRWLTGGVLISAAILKGYALATDPLADTGIVGPRWFAIALVEFEFLLGIWLLSGVGRGAARRVALLAFASFAVISLIKGVSSEATCGCFGRMAVSPWLTLALDIGATSALMFRPSVSTPPRAPASGRAIAIAILLITIAGVGALKMSRVLRNASPGVPGLVCEEGVHDFGQVAPEKAMTLEHLFVLRNTSDHPIRIAKSQSTCGCTLGKIPSDPVAPGAQAPVTVTANWARRAGPHLEEVRLLTDEAIPRCTTLE